MTVDIAHLKTWIGREQTISDVVSPTLIRQFNAILNHPASSL